MCLLNDKYFILYFHNDFILLYTYNIHFIIHIQILQKWY